jgi:calmodulin
MVLGDMESYECDSETLVVFRTTMISRKSQSLILGQRVANLADLFRIVATSRISSPFIGSCPDESLVYIHLTLFSLSLSHPSIGTIELDELKQVMRKLGQNPSEAELVEMINSVDENGDNEIDFEEFLVLMKSRIGEKDPDKELRDAFAVFDSDGSGSIDRKELKRLMKKLGQKLSDEEVDAMMDEVDTNGDGEISFEEFKAMMVSQ